MLNTQTNTARRPRTARVDRVARTLAYYEAHAREYADGTMGLDTGAHMSRFAALLRPGARVLDAGCGGGRDLLAFAEMGYDAHGLDLSPALVEIARSVSHCPVSVGDLRSPPFQSASFDGVWAMASLLHLPIPDLKAALSELTRLLVPGGILFTSVKRGQGDVEDAAGRWFALHDEADWPAYLREAGLTVIEVVGEPAADLVPDGTVAPGWISALARKQ